VCYDMNISIPNDLKVVSFSSLQIDVNMILVNVFTLLALVHFSGAAEICCGATGCFNDGPPFNGFLLPSCPADCRIRYIMYTRANRNSGVTFDENSVPSVFNPARRTIFTAHGWNSNGDSSWQNAMKDTLLDREDMQVVVIDWGVCAQLLNYIKAASNTRTVGAQTSLVISNLLRVAGSAPHLMWCMGHSLGAHVCGHCGMKMPSATPLGRCTGLDPAGPYFDDVADKTVGINQRSGAFVDIIHTDLSLGTIRDLGHIDFYPSGGKNQPGCLRSELLNDDGYDRLDTDNELYNGCDHSRAHEFMSESVKNDCFQAKQRCTDYNNLPGSCTACGGCGAFPCAFMGYAADSSCNRSGMYYLTVTASPPFCTN